MPCRTEGALTAAELRRIEALRAAVEVAGWSRTASDPDAVIDAAEIFEGYLRGDREDGTDE